MYHFYPVADEEVFIFQETSWNLSGCIEVQISQRLNSAMPLFIAELLVFQVIEAKCVRLGVLLASG